MLAKIVHKMGPKYKPDLDTLQAELRDLAHDYLIAALSAPFGIGGGPENMNRNERKRFLEPHVLNPARTLLEALSEENEHKFFEWPDEKIGPDPNKPLLIQELKRLIHRVEIVNAGQIERQGDGSDALTEFKMDFADALRMVFKKHFPALPAFVSPHDRAKRPSSEYFNFLRMCCDEIFKGDLVLAVELVDGVTGPKRKR